MNKKKKEQKQVGLGGPAFGFKNPRRKPEVKKDANLQILFKIAIINRRGKKICRKCYCRLPLRAHVCTKCHNPDLRYKKFNKRDDIFSLYADKTTKQKLLKIKK